MPQGVSTTVNLAVEEDITRARQAGFKMAGIAGYIEADKVRFATAVSELASNAVRYARRGVCALKIFHDPHQIRLIASVVDHGPGIPDIEAAMRDGFSTGNSLGKGLPGCRRLMDEFHIHSGANGTRVEICLKRDLFMSESVAKAAFGVSLRPYHGDQFCGDKGAVWVDENQALVCIVDGLGHGEAAEQAAMAAITFVSEHRGASIEEVFHECNIAIHDTRGVAMAIGVIKHATGKLRYGAIGNTRAAVIEGMEVTRIAADNGVVGGGYRNLLVNDYPISRRSTLVLWTDGLPEFLDFAPYRRELRMGLQAFADQLIEGHGTEDDDSGVVAYQQS